MLLKTNGYVWQEVAGLELLPLQEMKIQHIFNPTYSACLANT